MTVRTRLTLGLGVLVGALVGLGGLSAWELWRVSTLSRRIIAENYDSVVAAEEMKESLERQETALLLAVAGRQDVLRPPLAAQQARFDASWRRAAGNVTEPGEREIVQAIGVARDDYDRVAAQVLGDLPNRALDTAAVPNLAAPLRVLEPPLTAARAECDRLLAVNQDAMRRKADQAATLARRWFVATSVTAVTLVLGGALFALALGLSIVRPIRALTDATGRMVAGDFEAVVAVRWRDEMGVLAARFNDLAARIRELRRSDLGKVQLAEQTAVAAMNSLYDPIIVTDAGGRVQRLNRAAEPLFGSERSNLGRPVEEVTDRRLSNAILDVLESGSGPAADETAGFVPLRVEGIERAYRQRTTPMRDAQGRLVGAVLLLEDVTHLRQLDRLKSEFIAGASHELRTPVTTLQMGVHLLLEDQAGTLSPAQREILTMCRDDAMRLERLIRELLDLSRIEGGRDAPQIVATDPADLLCGAVEPMVRSAESAGLTLHLGDVARLPAVAADPGQIGRVLTNLLANAIRATAPGGRVDIVATARDGHLAIAVRDTGRGIPDDYLARVFEPFVQVPAAPSGGAGLGLSISRRIVEAHHGQLTVRSRLGEGTTFTVTLPLAAPVSAPVMRPD